MNRLFNNFFFLFFQKFIVMFESIDNEHSSDGYFLSGVLGKIRCVFFFCLTFYFQAVDFITIVLHY